MCSSSRRLTYQRSNERRYLRRTIGNGNADFFESRDLRLRGAAAAADDGAGVTHTLAFRSGAASDEGNDRFLEFSGGDERSRVFFIRAADFADQHHRVRLRIV